MQAVSTGLRPLVGQDGASMADEEDPHVVKELMPEYPTKRPQDGEGSSLLAASAPDRAAYAPQRASDSDGATF